MYFYLSVYPICIIVKKIPNFLDKVINILSGTQSTFVAIPEKVFEIYFEEKVIAKIVLKEGTFMKYKELFNM